MESGRPRFELEDVFAVGMEAVDGSAVCEDVLVAVAGVVGVWAYLVVEQWALFVGMALGPWACVHTSVVVVDGSKGP